MKKPLKYGQVRVRGRWTPAHQILIQRTGSVRIGSCGAHLWLNLASNIFLQELKRPPSNECAHCKRLRLKREAEATNKAQADKAAAPPKARAKPKRKAPAKRRSYRRIKKVA